MIAVPLSVGFNQTVGRKHYQAAISIFETNTIVFGHPVPAVGRPFLKFLKLLNRRKPVTGIVPGYDIFSLIIRKQRTSAIAYIPVGPADRQSEIDHPGGKRRYRFFLSLPGNGSVGRSRGSTPPPMRGIR